MGSDHLGTLFLLLFLVEITVSYPHHHQDISHSTPLNPQTKYTYTRFPDIEKHCGSFISSASELPPDDNRGERMKKELSFIHGDWVQESGGAPLMPFDSWDMPLKLVYFWLMDVDPIRRAKNTLSVSGAMDIGLFADDIFSHKPYNWQPQFEKGPRTTKLTILFEGIYVEPREKGGQGLMCLLGNATIPAPSSSQQMVSCEHSNPMSPVNPCPLEVNNQPFGLQDDQIVLVLQYAKTFTLTSRGITGTMQSLNQRWNLTYFDKIQISSQLWRKYCKYNFGSEELVSTACNPYPYPESLVNENVDLYKGDGYCDKLMEFLWNEVFELTSTLKNIFIVNDRSKVGPFLLDRQIAATYNSSDKLRLMIQDLECEPVIDHNGHNSALVSAVFRVIQRSELIYREKMRTGLSTMTLSMEGRWHSSDGQLCMVGCLGPSDGLRERCNYRVTLYLPLTFSINQRSPVFGTISSIDGLQSHAPLMFQRLADPQQYMNRQQCCGRINWSYRYSKLMQAKEYQMRSKPPMLGINLRKSLFRYPAFKGDCIASLSSLADELSIKACSALLTLKDSEASQIHVDIVLLSMGSFFGRYNPQSLEEKIELDKLLTSSANTYKEIEVSGHLSITGAQFYNVSLSFEGLYDPAIGKMYLIGCRDVQEFQEYNIDDRNLERGLDCLIEIKVEYSPKNAEWLFNPKIKLSLNSKRRIDDRLYLRPLSFNAFLVSYKTKFDEVVVLVRRRFEDGLRIVSLVMVILCIRGQTQYTKNHGHTTAYISLVMLGLHTVSFSIPLITGQKVFLKWKEFTEHTDDLYIFRMFSVNVCQAPDYTIKILLLFAFLEAKKLLKTVIKSRKVQKNLLIPSDKLVFLFSLLIHVLGFSTVHALRKSYVIPLTLESEKYKASSLRNGRPENWWTELENYSGLVQDFFLLPQIIGNVLWGVQGKPLRKLYYVGFTLVRLVFQAYDYTRDPVPYPRPPTGDLEFQYLRVEPYFKLGNMTIAAIVVALASTVHLQQKYGSWKRKMMRPTARKEARGV